LLARENFPNAYKASIKDADFHDIRKTCITEWLEQGLGPHEVQKLAGHSDINTTMDYYVEVRESLIDRARKASEKSLKGNFRAKSVRERKKRNSGEKSDLKNRISPTKTRT